MSFRVLSTVSIVYLSFLVQSKVSAVYLSLRVLPRVPCSLSSSYGVLDKLHLWVILLRQSYTAWNDWMTKQIPWPLVCKQTKLTGQPLVSEDSANFCW
jgi:hypothetical protein